MNRISYDFHTHSCLSPCADNDCTPSDLAGIASLNGVNVMALTDHNSAKNCPAFFKAAEHYGIIPIAGMELTTAEDIHMVCLFKELEEAVCFEKYLEDFRTKIKNRTDVFGEQLILDSEDNIVGLEDYYLPIALSLSIEEAFKAAAKYGGICYPAHIDRQSNGIISVLGAMPRHPIFPCVELNNTSSKEEITAKHSLFDKKILISSDAHRLCDLRESNDFMEINSDIRDTASVKQEIFEILRGLK